jgi:hypothetical protein
MEATEQAKDALPQLLGDFHPVDVWQTHMNQVFYGLRGHALRDYYQTFATADYRLAYALAHHYVEEVNARTRRGGGAVVGGTADKAPTLTVMEWGCGNGNLAACFLDRVQSLDTQGHIYSRLHYVLVDSDESILEEAKKNADLIKHFEKLAFVKSDIENLEMYSDGSVDRIVCNELWNELPTKLILRTSSELQEEHLRPNLKETRLEDYPDWSTFVNAFDQRDCDTLKGLPTFLEDIMWEREYHKVEGKDVPFRKVVTDFLRQIDDDVLVPINVGPANTLKEAKRLLASDAIGLSAFDAGTYEGQVLNDPEKPCYGMHGGQFSFMVNFSFLAHVADHLGGKAVLESQKEFVGRSVGSPVISLMDVLASFPELPQGPPWDMDKLILKTIQAINKTYQSPYQRQMAFPISEEVPMETRTELQALVNGLSVQGLPDTIAYVSEEEVFAVISDLEALGYTEQGLREMFRMPAQPVDDYHFYFLP